VHQGYKQDRVLTVTHCPETGRGKKCCDLNHITFIYFSTKIGEGIIFDISLPGSSKNATCEKRTHENSRAREGTVFLVDDEDMIIDVASEMIRQLGFDVLVATNGNEALDIYLKNQDKIDIVILDMMMPGMDGGATYDKLIKIDPDTKVLLSSGYNLDNQAQEIIDRGCNGFIQKPFNMDALSSKIASVM